MYCRYTIGLSYVREVGLEPTESKDSGFTVHPRCRWSTPDYMVGPHGIEPRSLDFQSSAYIKSAKAPFAVAPDGFEPPLADPESAVLTVTP